MITKEELLKGKKPIKALLIGSSGSGKTYVAGTFKKTYFINTEPGGMDTITVNPNLMANLIGYEEFIPKSKQDTMRVFKLLAEELVKVRTLIKEGKVETVVLDNITYLALNRMAYIKEYEPKITYKGEVDKRAMFGELGDWLWEFVQYSLLSLPCNVIVTAHEQLESDEAMAKKPDQNAKILANILGGFRDKIEGMFSLVLFLTKLDKGQGNYEYWARANKGQGKNGKNRYNLPATIKDVSYSTIINVIEQSMTQKGAK